MPSDEEYVGRKGEALWDHANRIAVLALAESTVRLLDSDKPAGAKEAGHYFGAYQQSFTKTRSALLDLFRARAEMHRVIHWEPTGAGRYRTQPITESDTETISALSEAAARFVSFVVSWQPVMDSIAAHVATVMAPRGPKLPTDMLRSAKAAAIEKLPDSASSLK